MTHSHVTAPTEFVEAAGVMVPTINSFALFQPLPNARLSLYPDSGHDALFQYADAFVGRGCNSSRTDTYAPRARAMRVFADA